MLTSGQIEHVKCFLREDWVAEEQLLFVVEQLISFTAVGYECFTRDRTKKKLQYLSPSVK
ncbi:MAG: hypothetical protein ACD_78C00274G0013 [uncultured bacterium (gcode 4)]|uniref:Uncharacterized protein n=1 Tax=uncultured bacterium (gcode 4) TaxID=1234023 RepID=K1XXU3_9BACT|nr:MAG: hypothetical protein ACD_78C00274G0013 [uncultured bacterium (gcode 4)]